MCVRRASLSCRHRFWRYPLLLTFPIVAEQLHTDRFRSIFPEDPETEIASARLCMSPEKYQEDALCIFTGSGTLPGLYADTAEQAVLLLNQVQDVFDFYNRWHDRILTALLRRESLQEMLEIAVEVLRNPVAVIDSSFVTLLYAGRIHGDLTGSVWDSVIHNGYFRVEEYPRQLNQKLFSKARSREIHLYDPEYANHEMHLAAPLCYKNRYFACIGSCDINAPFSQGQIQLIGRVRDLLEYAFEQHNIFDFYDEDNTGFIDQLIRGQRPAPKPLKFYLGKKNWKLNDAFQVLVLGTHPEDKGQDLNKRPYAFRLRLLFPDSVITFTSSFLVCILHRPESQLTADRLRELTAFLNTTGLSCGISTVFSDFTHLEYAWQQGRIALKRSGGDGQPVAFFLSDYKNMLLECLYSASNIKSFCHPYLLRLFQERKPEAFAILDTVRAYLNNGGNMSRTADALPIHRNTLLHRLDRILDGCGIDLRNLTEDQRFYLQFSCIILDYLAEKEEVSEPAP